MDLSRILMTVDYDRTLTDPFSRVPQRNLDAIVRFMDLGGSFTLNTGRSLPLGRYQAEHVPMNAPGIFYNGALAYDLPNERICFCTEIPLEPQALLNGLRENFPEMMVEVQGVNAHYGVPYEPLWFRYGQENHMRGQESGFSSMTGPFLKVSLFGKFRDGTVAQFYETTPEEEARFQEAERWLRRSFPGALSVVRGAPRILDAGAAGTSKGIAARRLAEEMGKILVCVGDGTNDASMLEEADFAFVPSDGHESLTSRFHNVCPCAQGSIADVVRILEKK